MKLLYVLRYWPTRSETFVTGEIAELRRRGHQVVVAAIGSRADGEGTDPISGLEVWRPPRGLGRLGAMVARRRVADGHPEAVGRLAQFQRSGDVSRACWVADRARGAGFDRVHAHFAGEAAEWAQLVAAVCGVPWSVTVHAVDLFRPRPGLTELLREASAVVTVCEHHRRWIAAHHAVDAVVVRCGVDPERWALPRRAGAAGARGEEEPLRVIAVARWVPKKGLDTLLEAVDLVREPLTLHLVCDPPAGAVSVGVRTGALDPEQVPDALANADVFVLPCRVATDGNRDGVPVALMEAMASGLPVITTPVSGIPELVDDTVGWLVPPDDAQALARALHEARDPKARERRGAVGRARVLGGWTLDGQVDGLLAVWGAA